jgi:hypothetical protein
MEDEIAFFKRITQALQVKKESGGDANQMSATQVGAAVIDASFGSHDSGIMGLVQYNYEKREDNEIDLTEGEYVTNIKIVDDDWWLGTNSKGGIGLFPSNYVDLFWAEKPLHQLLKLLSQRHHLAPHLAPLRLQSIDSKPLKTSISILLKELPLPT